ncbi:MAG: single-stranded DNA-binding protein [Christensenellales bacterium]
MNKAILVGRLTKDPDSRATSGGTPVCTFTIAINRRFANQQGERVADFIPIVAWRSLAENCSRYLKKGSNVAVVGSIQVRNYDANDGTKRYVTEIIADEVQFLDSKSSGQPSEGKPASNAPGPAAEEQDIPGFSVIEDDDLPF